MRKETIILSGAMTCLVCGCFAPEPPSIHSQDPDRLIPAIKIAVKEHDQSVIPILVDDLCSDDPAIRLYAINGLRRLTGEDFGYVSYADETVRKPAVTRWKAYVADHTF